MRLFFDSSTHCRASSYRVVRSATAGATATPYPGIEGAPTHTEDVATPRESKMTYDPLAQTSASTHVSLPLELGTGSVIGGKYTLLRPIGVGGMGAVWVARNEATGAEVALKLLLRHPDDGADIMVRFRQEAHTTARLSHRGIVRIYDLVEAGGGDSSLILVMELLRGQTLAAFLRERRRLPLEDALAIILPVLSALSHAHAAGIVHRDLKPENIFLAVDPDGLVTPKILDFGISKVRIPKAPIITRDGEMLGTPSYMSPEQVRGKPNVGRESDIFNVGILLYELLSGKNPFAGDGLHSMVVAILEETPAPLGIVPPGVWNVIERALRKSPRERYASAADLASALRLAVGLPLTPSTTPPEMVSVSGARIYRPSDRFTWAPSGPVQARAVSTRSRWIIGGIVAVAVGIITVPPLAVHVEEGAASPLEPAAPLSLPPAHGALAAPEPAADASVAIALDPGLRMSPAVPQVAAPAEEGTAGTARQEEANDTFATSRLAPDKGVVPPVAPAAPQPFDKKP